MKNVVFIVCLILCLSVSSQEVKWIDMGIKSDNGGILYWASSELVLRNNKISFANEGEEGTKFWLGDIVGTDNKSPLLSLSNMPLDIKHNSQYDIVTANFGNAFRLPSPNEFNNLIENCNIKYAEYKRSLDGLDTNGVPLWVQGQWIYQEINRISFSFKFDGPFVSVIQVSDAPTETLYEGLYNFSQNVISFWDEQLELDIENKRLKRKNGEYLKKVSNESSKTITRGYLLTSKINNNKLFFAIPSTYTSVSDGNVTLTYDNKKEGDYWTGNLVKDNGEFYGLFFRTNDEGHGILGNLVNEKKCYIKPVKISEEDIQTMPSMKEDAFLEKMSNINSFIESFYNEYIFGSNNFNDIAKNTCTPKLLKYLKESYDYECDGGECYAFWLFRSGAQDGINDLSKVINVEVVGNGWYKITYFDMGYKYATKVKIVNINGTIMFDEIGDTENIEHKETLEAYMDSINRSADINDANIENGQNNNENVYNDNVSYEEDSTTNNSSIFLVGGIVLILAIMIMIKRKKKS